MHFSVEKTQIIEGIDASICPISEEKPNTYFKLH